MEINANLLVDYFSWHAMNRRRLTETNWKTTHKYLIIRCTKEDQKCGGLSDRLKPLPFFLLVAARTKRLLMIRWNKPAKLEEFLFPRNLNWSVPEWMEETIRNNETTVKFYRNAQKLAKRAKREKAVVIETRVQDMYGGSQIYEQILKGGDNSTVVQETYDVVYHDLFRALFSPAPPVAELIHEKMKAASLSPGEYAIAHYRAFYDIEHAKEKRSNKQIVAASINAVKCASELRPGGPVYFASDSKVAVDTVRKYANQENRSIVTFESEEALHIDRTDDWEARPASDFYSVFVDLFMMANGRCVTYGQGGFGRYALLLSYNATCESRHFYRGKQMKCEWKNLE